MSESKAQQEDKERRYDNTLAQREDKRVAQQEDGERQWDTQLGHAALLHLHPPLSLTSFFCNLVPVCPSLWLIVVCWGYT